VVSLVLPAASLYVRRDLGRLRQVVSNLVEKAAKYTEPGGRITVTVEQRGDEVVLVVSHNGIGIGAENLERIFEPFTQSHQPLASPSVDWESDSAWCAESWNCDPSADGALKRAMAGSMRAISLTWDVFSRSTCRGSSFPPLRQFSL
jgi:hypothetical protein